MMGLGRTALWTSWFIHYFLMIIIPVALVTIILCAPFTEYGSILQYSNWFLIFVFLLLWGTSLITLGFLISTWFSSANSTSAASGIWLCLDQHNLCIRLCYLRIYFNCAITTNIRNINFCGLSSIWFHQSKS